MKIFVYGTLMIGCENHERYLAGYFVDTVPGQIKGKLYHLKEGYPALIAGDDCVHGEVMTLQDERALIWLDELEDYDSNRKDNLYNRTIEEITLQDGEIVECYVYTYADENYVKKTGIYLEHGDWKKHINL